MTTTAATYTIVKSPSGDRAVKLANGNLIPCDIAALATGKDKWLSEIQCKCRDCGDRFPLSQLQGNGQWCDACQDASIENE